MDIAPVLAGIFDSICEYAGHLQVLHELKDIETMITVETIIIDL
jgi:hypothetical protein